MYHVRMKEIETEEELAAALDLCYRVLGEVNAELYGNEAWYKRFQEGMQPFVIALINDKIVSAVLGRAENRESLVMGFVACHEEYRKQGITKKLVAFFEQIAKEQGYQYITLGSKADAFYKACGYKKIDEIHEQSIFQKSLIE